MTKEQLAEEFSKKDKPTLYTQLISDIERTAFIAGFEAAQQWIPVDENTPSGVKLFVKDKDEHIAVAMNFGYYWESDNKYLDTEHITHFIQISC